MRDDWFEFFWKESGLAEITCQSWVESFFGEGTRIGRGAGLGMDPNWIPGAMAQELAFRFFALSGSKKRGNRGDNLSFSVSWIGPSKLGKLEEDRKGVISIIGGGVLMYR